MKQFLQAAILTAIIAGTACGAYAQSDTTLPERYEPKVVIEAPLIQEHGECAKEGVSIEGSKPGRFAYISEMGASEILPKDMDVDSAGNIYINDPVNNRIQKFDKDGKYLETIPVAQAYTLDPTGEGCWAGNYKSQIALAPDGSIYVYDEVKKEVELIDQKGAVLGKESLVRKEKGKKRVVEFKEYLRGKGESLIDHEIYGSFSSRGRHRENKNVKVQNRKSIIINLPDRSINVKTNFDIGGYELLGFDVFSDAFILVGTQGSVFIRKYNKGGKLLAHFVSWPRKDLSFVLPSKRFVDNNGNYYELGIDERSNKVRVIRWEMVK